MARYAVMQRYRSGTFGPWDAGSQVELDPAEAAWVNKDSPGTLKPVPAGLKFTQGQVPDIPDLPEEPEEPPAGDRYDDLDLDALRAEAKDRGVDARGGADTLRGKLRDADQATPAGEA